MKKILFFFVFILSFIPFHFVHAEEQPYSVEPLLPSNQDFGVTSYFSLNTNKNNFDQELRFKIKNNTAENLIISLRPLNALTSPNGVIEYVPTIKEGNSVLTDSTYSLAKYIKVPKNVTLNGNEEKEISIPVQASDIKGTILGAIGFQTVQKGEMQEVEKNQIRISNEINTIIGIQLNFGTVQVSDFEIGKPYVESMPSYYAVRLPITSKSPSILKNSNFDYEVLTKEGKSLFHTKQKVKLDFAPKTKVGLSIPWDSQQIEEGKTYILKGTLSYGDDQVRFEKEFKFVSNKSEHNGNGSETNRTIPDILKDYSWWWILLLIAIVCGILTYYVKKKKDKKKKLKEERKSEDKDGNQSSQE